MKSVFVALGNQERHETINAWKSLWYILFEDFLQDWYWSAAYSVYNEHIIIIQFARKYTLHSLKYRNTLHSAVKRKREKSTCAEIKHDFWMSV